MKINFDGIIYSLQQYGGISNYFTNLINHSSKLLPKKTQLSLYGNPELSSNIHCKTKYSKYRKFERYRNIKNLTDATILHSSYYRFSANKKIKSLITLYDFTYEIYEQSFRSYVHNYQKRRAIFNSEAIICISNSTKNDLLNFYPSLNEEKVFVTHLASSSGFKSLKIDHCKRVENPYVIFIGPRKGYKNFKVVVEALEITKNISLCIIGGGDLTQNESAFLDKKIQNRYYHLGYVSEAELNNLYNKAISLVYPSLYEGFGIPILEAQNANCPVICNKISSIPEVAGEGAIMLEKCTAESISQSINTLLEKDTFISIVNKGFKNSLNFSWMKTAEETIKIYKKLYNQ